MVFCCLKFFFLKRLRTDLFKDQMSLKIVINTYGDNQIHDDTTKPISDFIIGCNVIGA
jgi:hypothetical protein